MSTIRVYLLDDQAILRAGFRSLLTQSEDVEVVGECGDAREAVAELEQLEPDVILLDIMMPRLDGPGTFERLQADPECAAIPVVFMTAKAQRHELRGYTELGAAGVIAKPFDPLTLPDEIRSLLNQS